MADFKNSNAGIAADDQDVERRISAFLWRDPNPFGAALDSLMDGPFAHFKRCAIAGGMVRDIARGDAFDSDIDIVIEATIDEVATVAASLGARRNVFGGWRTRFGDADIDFWAFESTWTLRTGLVKGRSLDDFPKTTFFTHDAAVFDLNSHRVVSHGIFWDAIKRGEIEINVEPTPSIEGNLYRAARRILGWGLVVGPRLRRFIERYLDDDSFRKLLKIEAGKGHPPLIVRFQNSTELKAAVLGNRLGNEMMKLENPS